MQRIALGISDFKILRDNKAYFIDKSFFIKEVIDENFQTILLPRPRRFGRYDISIIPKDLSKKAIIMEFKTIRVKENKDTALDSAIKQLVEKKYETEILKRGIKDILRFGVVFDGKQVWIREV